MKMKHEKIYIALATLIVGAASSSCAGTGGPVRSEPPITSCPPGFVLICESRQKASKGGAEEEIPKYEHCRCKNAY